MPLPMYQQKEELPTTRVKHVIGIAAGKGGVGKSTVTVNLALALQKKGYTVGIIDADIYGPSLRKMLPEDTLPLQKGNIITPAICSGIKMISMAYFRNTNEAAAIRAPIVNSLISQFVKSVQWGNLDFLLIDFPPGTGDIQLTLSQQANFQGIIMVTTPQEVAVLDVRKAIHMFAQMNIPIIGIVENMSYYTLPSSQEKLYLFGKGGGHHLALETGVPLLASISIDPALSESGDKGYSLFSTPQYHHSPTVQTFYDLADQVVSYQPSNQKHAIVQLSQKDPHSFSITWNDGTILDYRLSDLQKCCPCAGCVEEGSGKRIVEEKSLDPNVKATEVSMVGRYAIRIRFTSGCSHGIYDFDMLREVGAVT